MPATKLFLETYRSIAIELSFTNMLQSRMGSGAEKELRQEGVWPCFAWSWTPCQKAQHRILQVYAGKITSADLRNTVVVVGACPGVEGGRKSPSSRKPPAASAVLLDAIVAIFVLLDPAELPPSSWVYISHLLPLFSIFLKKFIPESKSCTPYRLQHSQCIFSFISLSRSLFSVPHPSFIQLAFQCSSNTLLLPLKIDVFPLLSWEERSGCSSALLSLFHREIICQKGLSNNRCRLSCGKSLFLVGHLSSFDYPFNLSSYMASFP